MKTKTILFSIICILLAFPNLVIAQLTLDSTTQKEQIVFEKWFDNQVGVENALIYNGDTYPLIRKAKFGHQFLGNGQWQNGKVYLDEQWYFDVALLFDIIDEQLVAKPPESQIPNGILLNMSSIQYFTIGQASFIPILFKETNHFYEVVFEGKKLTLVSRHQKQLDLKPDGSHVKESVNYFILFKDDLIPLKSKQSLKQVSPNATIISKQIKSRNSKLNVRKKKLLVEFLRRFDEKI